MRKCKVYNNGEFAGILAEESSSRYSFTYDPEYLRSPNANRICLAMPLTSQRYESTFLFPFFSNMLPEGYNRAFLCKDYHLDRDDDFGLLLNIAQWDTIGAITVQPM
jgi:serine/threonine-protein kinase HipA